MELSFWHYYNFAQDGGDPIWRDGGAIQFSNDNGTSWQNVVPTPSYQGTLSGDYTGKCNDVVPELAGDDAWSGQIPGNDWSQVTVDVGNTYKTQQFMFRFLFASDKADEAVGWYIDDVEIGIE